MKKPARKGSDTEFVAEIDEAELVVRLIEGLVNSKRPDGCSAREALERTKPDLVLSARRAAKLMMEYVTECINAANRVN